MLARQLEAWPLIMAMHKSAVTLNSQINMQLHAQKKLRETNEKCNQYAFLHDDGTYNVLPCPDR